MDGVFFWLAVKCLLMQFSEKPLLDLFFLYLLLELMLRILWC